MTEPVRKVLDALEAAKLNPRQCGRGWQARCPAHEDNRPSLSVGVGSDGKALICCHAGCEYEAIIKALGLNGQARQQIVTEYDYVDESAKLLYQVCRTENKGFFQRRPDGHGGWINNLKGVRRVLYRIPELLAAPEATVYLPEGEKDCDRLASLGLLATTCPQGAGKWAKLSHDSALEGRHVVILPMQGRDGLAIDVVQHEGLADRLDEYDAYLAEAAKLWGVDAAEAERRIAFVMLREKAERAVNDRERERERVGIIARMAAAKEQCTGEPAIRRKMVELVKEMVPATPAPMTAGERAVWDLFEGKAYDSGEAAFRLPGVIASTVRHHVKNLRLKGYVFGDLNGRYYRPDAPPLGV